MLKSRVFALIVILGTTAWVIAGPLPVIQLPSYGALASVPAPDIESFRQYDMLFFFSLDEADVNAKLSGTNWVAISSPVQMTMAWVFQSTGNLVGGFPEGLPGPSSSVVFSFTARNVVTNENRRLVWAVRSDNDTAALLNSVLGGGNSVGNISSEFSDEDGALSFRGRVKTDFGLNIQASATLPKNTPLTAQERDPFGLKLSFVDWSTTPVAVFAPFSLADQYMQASYLSGDTGFTARLSSGGQTLEIPGDQNKLSGFEFAGSITNRMNRFLVLETE